MELIQHNDRIVALIFRPDPGLKGTNFFTPPEYSLQVGYLQYKSGESIPAHTHYKTERTVTGAAEIAIIQSGSCEVELFSEDGTPLSKHTLVAGNAIVMLTGGHSFRMMEDTSLYLIKQGPYGGSEEKIRMQK